MLKDIKNIMGTKRPNSDFNGSIRDLRSGMTYEIKTDKEFFIGRALSSSICIEELYISRRHSIINYENDEFVIYDNESSSGTYLNYSKLSNKKATLEDGDIISYTNIPKTWEFIYQFKISSVSKKKSRVDSESTAVKNHTANENYKELLRNLQAQVLELKIDKLVIYDKALSDITEFKNMLNDAIDDVNKTRLEIIKEKAATQKLHKMLALGRKKLQHQVSLDIFKSQINKVLDSDMQCPICNEVMIRVNMTSCCHLFCENCIKQWLNKSKVCPVCRGVVQKVYHCPTFDGFLTNIYDNLGGIIKEQRVNLQHERVIEAQPVQTARRGRRRSNQPNVRRRVNLAYDIPIENIRDFQQPVIEVVDLTHSMSL